MERLRELEEATKREGESQGEKKCECGGDRGNGGGGAGVFYHQRTYDTLNERTGNDANSQFSTYQSRFSDSTRSSSSQGSRSRKQRSSQPTYTTAATTGTHGQGSIREYYAPNAGRHNSAHSSVNTKTPKLNTEKKLPPLPPPVTPRTWRRRKRTSKEKVTAVVGETVVNAGETLWKEIKKSAKGAGKLVCVDTDTTRTEKRDELKRRIRRVNLDDRVPNATAQTPRVRTGGYKT